VSKKISVDEIPQLLVQIPAGRLLVNADTLQPPSDAEASMPASIDLRRRAISTS
jgi:hypothetical protein